MKKIKDEYIHIAFGVHDEKDDYCIHTAVSIISIIHNTNSNVMIHILHDNTISTENQLKIKKMVEIGGGVVRFYSVKLLKDMWKFKDIQTFSPGALLRLKLVEVLPNDLSKIIYLDSDVVVEMDITRLWNIDIKKYAMAVVLDRLVIGSDIQSTKKLNIGLPLDFNRYFNSGVLFLNLIKIRLEYNMFEDCFSFLMNYPKAPFLDQPALNYVFQKDCLFLPDEYNFYPYRNDIKSNCIYHFLGRDKPWNIRKNEIDYLYWKYFKMTPWGNIENFIACYNCTKVFLETIILEWPIQNRKKFVFNVLQRIFREIQFKFKEIRECMNECINRYIK